MCASRPSEGIWTDLVCQASQITIVDLSCPCVTAESACALFNICLNLFLEQPSTIGRVIALDEAHKYMTNSAECQTLTESLLSIIRLQRHLGARIIVSTQEPTISPKLLDLCSVTIVHRFTSPDWLTSLKKHLAGASTLNMDKTGKCMFPDDPSESTTDDEDAEYAKFASSDPMTILFSKIVSLRTGEALLFAPSAIIDIQKTSGSQGDNGERDDDEDSEDNDDSDSGESDDHARSSDGNCSESSESTSDDTHDEIKKKVVRLGQGVMKIRIRERITADGGRSVMAG